MSNNIDKETLAKLAETQDLFNQIFEQKSDDVHDIECDRYENGTNFLVTGIWGALTSILVGTFTIAAGITAAPVILVGGGIFLAVGGFFLAKELRLNRDLKAARSDLEEFESDPGPALAQRAAAREQEQLLRLSQAQDEFKSAQRSLESAKAPFQKAQARVKKETAAVKPANDQSAPAAKGPAKTKAASAAKPA